MFSAGSSKRKITLSDYDQVGQILQHLGMIVQHTTEGVVVVDLRGMIHFVNAAWAGMHGFDDAASLLQKSVATFYCKDQMQFDIAAFLKDAAHKGRLAAATKHVRKNGTSFRAQTRAIALEDEAGKAIGLIIFDIDLTECVQSKEGARQTPAQLAAAVEGLQQQITEYDQAQEQLKQQLAGSTGANEELQHQITEHEQAEQRLKQEAAELAAANEQLRHQIMARKRAEERLEKVTGTLTALCEQLEQQVTDNEKASESLKGQATELLAACEQHAPRPDGQELSDDGDQDAESQCLIEPFSVEKLAAVASLARRLSGPADDTDDAKE